MKIQVPTAWEDITIGEYYEVQRIYQTRSTKEVAAIETLALLCNISVRQIRKLKSADIQRVVEEMKFLYEPLDVSKPELIRTFVYEGVEYGIIPNLSDITVGEFADIDAYSKDGFDKTLHKVMSVLYRPITRRAGKFYEIEDYNPKEVDLEKALKFRMDVAISAMVFFYALGKKLAADTHDFLKGKGQAHS